MGDRCRTKYPLLLLHGAGFRDLRLPLYWGRIPQALAREGARIFYGGQDCWASVETNAEAVAARIADIVRQTECGKVNIIAHSKGGLDARMAACRFGCAGQIASITTVATPHRGSRTIDRLIPLARPVWSIAAFAVNNWIRLVGDRKPDFLRLCRDLTTEHMRRFNAQNPDVPGIFYQSYACIMKHPFSDLHLSTANWILGRIEGENDGLVSVESALWGEERHVVRSAGFRGVSHLDAIDLRRAPLTRKRSGGVRDICELYVSIAEDLQRRGL